MLSSLILSYLLGCDELKNFSAHWLKIDPQKIIFLLWLNQIKFKLFHFFVIHAIFFDLSCQRIHFFDKTLIFWHGGVISMLPLFIRLLQFLRIFQLFDKFGVGLDELKLEVVYLALRGVSCMRIGVILSIFIFKIGHNECLYWNWVD